MHVYFSGEIMLARHAAQRPNFLKPGNNVLDMYRMVPY